MFKPKSTSDDRLSGSGERISALLDGIGAGGAVARNRAEELVREVTDLYGEGLERIVAFLTESGSSLDDLLADDLVAGLLLVHGLHPQDLGQRVGGALERVRPYLGSHGGDVELIGISPEGVVTLKLLGSCHGCPSSSVTLKLAVEDAIEAAAPEVTSIVVAEDSAKATPALIPVESLRIRLHGTGETGGGSWEPVPELADLKPGEVAGFLVAGMQVLACRTTADVFTFRDACPHCGGSMAGAALQRALAAPTGGGLLRCPTCRKHYDVRAAGACLEDKSIHLDPLPLLIRGGIPSIAIPSAADHTGAAG